MYQNYSSDEIDRCITEINDEIALRLGKEEFKIFINERYWARLQKSLKMENIEFVLTKNLENSQVAIFVNKKYLDGGLL